MKKIFLTFTLAAMALPSVAQAAEPKLEGTFTDWAVYSRSEGGDKICYAIAEPKSKSPASLLLLNLDFDSAALIMVFSSFRLEKI